jgi:hypothetical protein
VLEASREAKAKHSPLYLWMRDNYEELRAEFDLHGPRWRERHKALCDVGLKDQDDKPPTFRGAQDTWYRVVRDMEAKGGVRAAEPKPKAVRRKGEASEEKPALPAPRTDPMARLMVEINSRSGRKEDDKN